MMAKVSPLGGKKIGIVESVQMRELPVLHTIDLRVAPGSAAQAAVVGALGFELPGKPGQGHSVSSSGEVEVHCLCLAPDWWLIMGSQESEQRLFALKSTDQFHFSAVDVSGQRTTIELEGPNAQDLLAHLWEQDLREKSFPVRSVSQGLMAKAPVILYHITPHRYRVMVRSSFALHLWMVMEDAAEEWV